MRLTRTVGAVFAAGLLLSACMPTPAPLQKGMGLEITPQGIGLVGGRNGVSEFHGFGCSNEVLGRIGTKRERPTSVQKGMTSCDLYYLKGDPVRTSERNFMRGAGSVPNRYVMVYNEGGAQKKYIFKSGLLASVE